MYTLYILAFNCEDFLASFNLKEIMSNENNSIWGKLAEVTRSSLGTIISLTDIKIKVFILSLINLLISSLVRQVPLHSFK